MKATYRKIPRDGFDVLDAMKAYPRCGSWAEIAAAMELSERYANSPWCQNAFETAKEHGTALSRTLMFPKIHKMGEIFESVRLERYGSNRDAEKYGTAYPNGGGCFVSGRNVDVPFFYPKASRYIKTRKNGEFFCHGLSGDTSILLTVAKLKPEYVDAVCGEHEDRRSFELIRHENGKTLFIANNSNLCWRSYVAYFDKGQHVNDMLPTADLELYRAALARDVAAKECVGVDGKTVDFELAAERGIEIRKDKY